MHLLINILRASLFVEMAQKHLTHFFANDSLLFCWGRLDDVRSIQEILRKFEQASSKKLTLRRQHFFFPNQNVSELEKGVSEKSVGGSEDKEYEKYLGLPIVVGRNKKASLNYIKDRVWGKL